MDKCLACQFYDRQLAKPSDAKGTQWGQCRKNAPMLHPINAKSYMIEGVWPHVRDDDWCGEWKQGARRPEPRIATEVSAGVVAASVRPVVPAPRPAPFSTVFGGASKIGATPAGVANAPAGRGD